MMHIVHKSGPQREGLTNAELVNKKARLKVSDATPGVNKRHVMKKQMLARMTGVFIKTRRRKTSFEDSSAIYKTISGE